MSILEILMLVCFGVAWPFSIWKSYSSKSNGGKSLLFLVVIFVGYVAGVLHKLLYAFDEVIYLYALNGLMVLVDIIIFFRNERLHAGGRKQKT